MTAATNYYHILGLQDKQNSDSLDVQEVKQAYRRALLQYHPDKQLPEHTASTVATVDEISHAFKVLSDPVLRGEYNRQLHVARQDSQSLSNRANGHRTGMETVDLDDLIEDEESGQWRRSCRCGSEPAYVVTEAELEKNVDYGELVVGCKGCSLWLKVLFSAGG